eukprot:5375611-Prymnesium_polylepis.1
MVMGTAGAPVPQLPSAFSPCAHSVLPPRPLPGGALSRRESETLTAVRGQTDATAVSYEPGPRMDTDPPESLSSWCQLYSSKSLPDT